VLPLLLCILRCDEEFRPTYFFKSKSLFVKLIFMFFERLILIANKSHLRRWTFKRSQAMFDEMKKFMNWFYFGFAY